MASFNAPPEFRPGSQPSREAKRALKDLPGEFPRFDWFCLGVWFLTGVFVGTLLFGCIALAFELRSFWP